MLEEDMLAMKVWAVVGANQNREKYGNMIYRKLKRRHYQVYAVNPQYETIEGDRCYPTLSDLPEKPDVVNLVVGPAITMHVLEEACKLGIENVWFQPGTYDETVQEMAEKLGLKAVYACVLWQRANQADLLYQAGAEIPFDPIR